MRNTFARLGSELQSSGSLVLRSTNRSEHPTCVLSSFSLLDVQFFESTLCTAVISSQSEVDVQLVGRLFHCQYSVLDAIVEGIKYIDKLV